MVLTDLHSICVMSKPVHLGIEFDIWDDYRSTHQHVRSAQQKQCSSSIDLKYYFCLFLCGAEVKANRAYFHVCRLLREQWIRAKYERNEFEFIEKQEPYSAGMCILSLYDYVCVCLCPLWLKQNIATKLQYSFMSIVSNMYILAFGVIQLHTNNLNFKAWTAKLLLISEPPPTSFSCCVSIWALCFFVVFFCWHITPF